MTNEKLKMWWETARPKTLPLALASIFTGSALGYWANPQGFNGLVMALCLHFSKRAEMGINSNGGGKFSFRKFLDWNRL